MISNMLTRGTVLLFLRGCNSCEYGIGRRCFSGVDPRWYIASGYGHNIGFGFLLRNESNDTSGDFGSRYFIIHRSRPYFTITSRRAPGSFISQGGDMYN